MTLAALDAPPLARFTSAAGLVIGALLIGRLMRPSARVRWMRALAALAFVPLVLTAFHPPVWGAMLLWGLSGVGLAYQIPANATFMLAVPPDARGRAFGLAQTGIQALQGICIAIAGALALTLPVHHVIALSGALGLVALALLGFTWPYADLAALHGPVPVEESLDDMTFGEIPIEEPAPLVPDLPALWTGPYPLSPRERVLKLRLSDSKPE